MGYAEYQELKNLIDVYRETGNRQALETIRNYIKTKGGCREELIKDIEEGHYEYINLFSCDDRVQIVSDLAAQIKQDKFLAGRVSWMLAYLSDKDLEQILSKADDVALVRIMHAIDGNIRIIGRRLCDHSTYLWFETTTFFSRMWKKRNGVSSIENAKNILIGNILFALE